MFFRKINSKAKSLTDTGFGNAASNYGGRLINKDGMPNIKKTGIPFLERYSWYHSMLTMSGGKFFVIILAFFVMINFFFAILYYMLGVENLVGMHAGTAVEKFGEAFFFSTQTFTTVGYGRISPTGFLTNAISSIQALIGLLSFSVATGLMYGRFSLPKAYLKFSSKAIVSPFKEGQALMIRFAPYKNTILTDASCTLTLAMIVEENGNLANRFFPLDLEYSKVNALTLNWTVVHVIDESSPLYQFTKEDFMNNAGEIIVFVKAFDDKYSNTVVARTSYTFQEIHYGYKFKPMFYADEKSSSTILDLDKLDAIEKAPFTVNAIS